jgi:hypothetical protein
MSHFQLLHLTLHPLSHLIEPLRVLFPHPYGQIVNRKDINVYFPESSCAALLAGEVAFADQPNGIVSVSLGRADAITKLELASKPCLKGHLKVKYIAIPPSDSID